MKAIYCVALIATAALANGAPLAFRIDDLERLGILLSDAGTRREAARRERGFGGEGARSAGRAPRIRVGPPEVLGVATVRAADDAAGAAVARPLVGGDDPSAG